MAVVPKLPRRPPRSVVALPAATLAGLTGEAGLVSAFWALVLRDLPRGRADHRAEAQAFLEDPAARQLWLDLAGLDLDALTCWIQAQRPS